MSNSTQEPQFDVSRCREQFPALSRKIGDLTAVYFDGPAGSQVPQCVVDAIGNYMLTMNANHGGVYQTSRESDRSPPAPTSGPRSRFDPSAPASGIMPDREPPRNRGDDAEN